MLYSKSTRGFYDLDLHTPEQIPADAIEITAEDHANLMAAQSAGNSIGANDEGFPVAVPPTERSLTLSKIAELEAMITPRRLREAVLGTDGGWLETIDAKIATLRAKL